MKKSFTMKYPYINAILIGVLCTFLTGLGVAIPQILGLTEDQTYIFATVTLIFSVGVGILIMKKSRFSLSEYGFRASDNKSYKKVWWYIPLVMIEVLPLMFFGFNSDNTLMKYVIFLFFTIAVGFNEEIYFRALIYKFLEEKGSKQAIIWSSVIFGVLHLANAFNGKNTLYLILQMLFAFLVGFVLAEILCITKSIWLVILWHATHDYIAFTTNETLDSKGLIILAIQVVILFIYAIGIWMNGMRQETTRKKEVIV